MLSCDECLTYPICRNKIIKGISDNPIAYKAWMIITTYHKEIKPKCNVIEESIPYDDLTDITLLRCIIECFQIERECDLKL